MVKLKYMNYISQLSPIIIVSLVHYHTLWMSFLFSVLKKTFVTWKINDVYDDDDDGMYRG